MKSIKILFFCFCLLSLCSCGSKSVKGENGVEYESYQEACRHQDFVAAYDWIEKNKGSEEDKDYVFNAEMLYLTSLNTEEASNRIIYLLAEYQIPGTPVHQDGQFDEKAGTYKDAKKYVEGIKRFNKRCDNVLDMAIAQKNVQLANKILPLYKQDIKYAESKYRGEGHYIKISKNPFTWDSKNAAEEKVFQVEDKVFQVEVLSLISLNTEEATNRIVYLLTSFQILGTRVQECKEYDDKAGTYKDAKQYVEGVKRINQRCNYVLDMAIAHNNKQLANKIIPLYKQDIDYREYNNPDTYGHSISIECKNAFSWDSKNAAQEKFKKTLGGN